MKQTDNIPAGYKCSSLGIIPKEWEVKKINNICEFLSNNTLSHDKLNYESGNILNIHYGDVLIKFGYILDVSIKKLPYINEDIDYIAKHYISEGDIIIADTAEDETVGKACEVVGVKNKKIVSGLHTFWLRPKENSFAPRFLGYLINSKTYHNQLLPLIQGIKVCSVSKQAIGETCLILPPFSEQQMIAEILSVWDSAIEMQSALIEKLETRKRGLMQQLLTCLGESHSPSKRLKGFSGEWKRVKLGDLFDERNERNFQRLNLLSIGQEGVYLQSESVKRDISNDDKSNYKRICPNDIGYNTMRMWQGRSALSTLEGIVSPAYTIVKPNPTVDALFISVLIKQKRVVYDFWTHSQGLVSDTLNCKFPDFAQVKVIIPTLPEQTAIAEILTTADNEITLAKQKLESLRRQKKGLMQVLLTGKKRVKI